MKTIGRSKQFEDIVLRLKTMQQGDSTIPLHLSVTAPRRGGLSLFLSDLFSELSAGPEFLPVKAEVNDGFDKEEVETVLRRLFEEVTQELGEKAKYDGLIVTLLQACNRLRDQNKLPVLIIDAAEGIREIERRQGDTSDATNARLLDKLRVLATLQNDCSANLGVVVGWDDEFESLSGGWGVHDVVQRYSPDIRLWPDFESPEPWGEYAKVLNANGFRVDEAFPGFPRTGIPVGKILDRLSKTETKSIDGVFLLEMLSQHLELPNGFEQSACKQAIVKLVLQDKSLTPEERNHLEQLKSSMDVTADGVYIANEELYELFSVQPAKTLLSLERQTAQDFEHQPQALLGELGCGIAALLGKGDAEITLVDDFAFFEVGDNNDFETEGLSGSGIHGVLWLGHEDGQQLLSHLIDRVREFECDSKNRFNRVLYFFHRSDFSPHSIGENIVEQLEKEFPAFRHLAKVISKKKAPITFCPIELSVENAIELRYLSRDSARNAERSRTTFRLQIKRQSNRIHKDYPRIDALMFEKDVLSKLILRAYVGLNLEKLADLCELPVAKAKEVISLLGKARVVHEFDGKWFWNPVKDMLYQSICENEVAVHFLFRQQTWDQLREAIYEAYGEELVKWDTDTTELRSVNKGFEFLERRAQALVTQFNGQLAELEKVSGEETASTSTSSRDALLNAERVEDLDKFTQQIVAETDGLTNKIAGIKSEHKALGSTVQELMDRLQDLPDTFESEIEKEKETLRLTALPNSKADLGALRDELKLYFRKHEKAERDRATALELIGLCSDQLGNSEMTSELVTRSQKFSSRPDIASRTKDVTQAENDIRSKLSEWQKNLPEKPASQLTAELEEVSKSIGENEANKNRLSAELSVSHPLVNEKVSVDTQPKKTPQSEQTTDDLSTEPQFERRTFSSAPNDIAEIITVLESGRLINGFDVKD
jgi:hypothetical protein